MGKNKTQTADLASELLAGSKKHLANVIAVMLGSTSYTLAEVQASLQALANLRADVESAKATTRAKVVAEAERAPALRSLQASFVAYVRSAFGNSPDVLADFGLKPKKTPKALTAEAKADAAAKRKATREARHTMGKNQKKAIHGTAPAAAPAGGAPSPAPSPAAPSPVAPPKVGS